MNIFNHFQVLVKSIIENLAEQGAVPSGLDMARVTAEPPRDPAHGDVATNAAMVLAKPAGMKPRDLADLIAPQLAEAEGVLETDIAGPGFINARLSDDFWRERLADILEEGGTYGNSGVGAGEKVNVEFVSANPTGDLHVGHARGAVFGDALASLLETAGYDVTREYYINDAGKQVDILAESFLMRIDQLEGADIPDSAFEGYYPGEEVMEAAKEALRGPEGDDLRVKEPASEDKRRAVARTLAVDFMMKRIERDLADLGVSFDVFTSERALVEAGKVDEALAVLEGRGLIYEGVLEPPKGKLPEDWEERPQTLFKATEFGDDVDRPLKKSDGSWTYFASDIAYHLDKFNRGFRTMIDVWGADHGGYVKRVQAALRAVTDGQADLDVKLCQLVHLFNKGEPVRMSKRAGNVVTVRDVLDEVGKDVTRFIMLTRKNDAPLDFDYAKVTEQSKDNPVFYVQYAHARSCSVFRQAKEALPDVDLDDKALRKAELARLTDEGELGLIKKLAGWPKVVESAAEAHEPHRLAFYLNEIAADFHGHWNRGRDHPELRFIVDDDPELTLARLALVRGMAAIVASGLRIMGVEPAEEMR